MGISQSSECKLQAMKLSNQRSWYFDDVIAPVNVSYECLESSNMYSSSSYQQASSAGQGSPLWTSSNPYGKQCIQRWPALTRSSFHLVGGSFQPQQPSSLCAVWSDSCHFNQCLSDKIDRRPDQGGRNGMGSDGVRPVWRTLGRPCLKYLRQLPYRINISPLSNT